jgi:hypothetical protein
MSQNSRNQGFFYCSMIEGSRFRPLTNGSGSGARRPKTYGSSGSASAALLVTSSNKNALLLEDRRYKAKVICIVGGNSL